MRNITTVLLIIISTISYAQTKIAFNTPGGIKRFVMDTSKACDSTTVFMIVEEMPSYIGGNEKLENDLNQKIILDKKFKGTSVIWFGINCKGEAFSFQCLKGSDEQFNKELIESLPLLQNWRAGRQRNKEVDCSKMIRLSAKKGKIKII